jgi:hypothetical protein
MAAARGRSRHPPLLGRHRPGRLCPAVGAERPDVVFRVPNCEIARSVVLVLQALEDLGPMGRGPLEQPVGVVADDVDGERPPRRRRRALSRCPRYLLYSASVRSARSAWHRTFLRRGIAPGVIRRREASRGSRRIQNRLHEIRRCEHDGDGEPNRLTRPRSATSRRELVVDYLCEIAKDRHRARSRDGCSIDGPGDGRSRATAHAFPENVDASDRDTGPKGKLSSQRQVKAMDRPSVCVYHRRRSSTRGGSGSCRRSGDSCPCYP